MRLHHVVLVLSARAPHPPDHTLVEQGPEVPPHARIEDHLTQWVTVTYVPDARIEAHYLFDDTYVQAHPEALNHQHLALLQAMLTAKLLDEGDVVVTRTMLDGSCRWPSVHRRRKALTDE